MTNQNIQAKTQIQNNTKHLSGVAVYCQLMGNKPHPVQDIIAKKQGLKKYRIQQEHEAVVEFRKNLTLNLVSGGLDIFLANSVIEAFDESLAVGVSDVLEGSIRANGFLIGKFLQTTSKGLDFMASCELVGDLVKLDAILAETDEEFAPSMYGYVSHDFLAKLNVKEELQTKVLQDILKVYEYVKTLDNSLARFFQSMYLGGYNTSAIISTWEFLEGEAEK